MPKVAVFVLCDPLPQRLTEAASFVYEKFALVGENGEDLIFDRMDTSQIVSNIPGIRLCPVRADVKSNYAYYPVVFDGYKETRDEIHGKLAEHDIIARKYFYPLTNSFDCYKGQPGFDPDATPVAKYIADRVLTLPLYADLSEEDVDRICDVIQA